MNRIFRPASKSQIPSKAIPVVCHPIRRLRQDAEAILRDVAFVLALTRRVKAEIVEEATRTEPAAL